MRPRLVFYLTHSMKIYLAPIRFLDYNGFIFNREEFP